MTDTPAYSGGNLSRPISPTKPTPKSMPTAVRLTMSEPCKPQFAAWPNRTGAPSLPSAQVVNL